MKKPLRKLGVTTHVAFSVGWLGAEVGFLALAIVGLTSQDVQEVRAAYLAMDLIGWFVIVPFSFAALITGLILALGTPWGLFRYYWIVAKFLLTIGAILVLLVHTNAMQEAASRVSGVAAETLFGARAHLRASGAGGHLGDLQMQLLVAAGAGLLVLLTTTTLGVYKPWGKTRYGQRKVSQP
ncbi:MAG: hypothetical protein HY313_02550 [Acidobacteria bacterium]|nr:hypothetical protein [Acidobacteriota bacterium]